MKNYGIFNKNKLICYGLNKGELTKIAEKLRLEVKEVGELPNTDSLTDEGVATSSIEEDKELSEKTK